LIWASKLQTEIAVSSTESEYVALSQSLREVIPIMGLIAELQQEGFNFNNNVPIVSCKAFEDNNGALEMATVHKYHHFREAVKEREIKLE
jgi:hypothetical protein